MVDLGGGQDGPIEHGFSNSVFILPGIIFVSLSGRAGALFYETETLPKQHDLSSPKHLGKF
ncbi:hypothetical protein NQ315_007241 [Exocentrus adspersus]|uniref:Uncharacterized protein n=1 Tax=Exocentrus adspersus TaxID=1586481 RepID=A0AAV8WCV5_9CUCU|nr:hypothetical protein NQ315_007241 [Exocentrus adspersus]